VSAARAGAEAVPRRKTAAAIRHIRSIGDPLHRNAIPG
jgi:hypothetical protein